AISDNGKPEYFTTARRRFLRSLWQEINILWKSTREETKTPPFYIIWFLHNLFDESGHQSNEEREEEKEDE
ncbi:hypothetical protein BYT27DRAFT_7185288, partial [Phlegmacium glaucopus]